MKRRKFLQSGLGTAPLILSRAIRFDSFPDRTNKFFKVNSADGILHGHIQLQGNNKNFLDIKVSGKDTNGDLAVFQSTPLTPKGGPPLNVHFNQNEIFYVLEGEDVFQVEEEKYYLKAFYTIFTPMKVPHAWAQVHETCKLIIILQSAGMMEEFLLISTSMSNSGFIPEQRALNIRKYGYKISWFPLKVN